MAHGRRGNREGSIVKRSDGRWMARASLPNGKRRAVYGTTRQDVAAKLNAMLRDVERGMPALDERQTVAAYLDHWLASSVKPNVRPATYTSYARHVRMHLAPTLGRHKLTRLTPQHVEALWAAKLADGLSASTIQRIRATLRRALNQALKWELVSRNVAALANAPKATRPHFDPLTPDQARALIAAARGDRLEALYHLVLSTGLRSGEALGLRWEDVDLDGRAVTVRKSLQRIDGVLTLVEPKTRTSRRTVPFPAGVAAKLREHRARQNRDRLAAGDRWRESGHVFASTIGTPLDGPNVTKAFQRLLASAGLPHKRFHDLRHACATYLLLQGVDLRVVSDILGHSQISLTADTYAHVLPSLKSDASDKLGGLLWADSAG